MTKQKIVHLQFKKRLDSEEENYYFGCIKAIYDCFDETRIGIKYKSLTNALRDTDSYENKMCIIHVGALIPKQQTNKKSSSC